MLFKNKEKERNISKKLRNYFIKYLLKEMNKKFDT